MAGLHQTKLEVEDQKKEMTKDFGARIQKFESDIHVLSRKITTKKEARDVNCFWEFDYSKGEKTLFRTDTGEGVKVETISAIERQRYIEFVEKEKDKSDAMPEAIKKAEEKKADKKGAAKKDRKCPHCGAKEGKEHFSACPNAETPEAKEEKLEISGEEAGEAADNIEEVLEEDLASTTEEEETPPCGPPAEDIPEEVDCFGTFDSNDAECANCDRLQECSKETISEEPAAEEPAVEEAKDEAQEKLFYTCKQCGKGFNEYVDKGDGVWECPHCNSDTWM
jgi:DNA-directed RNA polymerase subunit RPC12/RpoP